MVQQSATFSLAAWLPDLPRSLPSFEQGRLIGALPVHTCTNALPGQFPGTFIPFKDFTPISDQMDYVASLSFLATRGDGVRFQFIGTTAAIYLIENGTGVANDVSKAGGYTGNVTTYWSFAQYGDRVIATNGIDDVQTFDLVLDVLFSDLPGNPPISKHVWTQGSFVFLGNLINDVDLGAAASGYRNCGIDDPTDWTSSTTTQCSAALLNGDGGEITGGCEISSCGLIFQQHNIWRVTYIGSPLIFDVKSFVRQVGAFPRSILVLNESAYFWEDKGIFSCDGGSIGSISARKIDSFIKADAITTEMNISCAVDVNEEILYWAYQGGSGVLEEDDYDDTVVDFTRVLAYRVPTQEWTRINQEGSVLGVGLGIAYNLDTIDALAELPAFGIDNFTTISFDNPIYNSTLPVVGCVNGLYWGTFTGNNKSVGLETKSIRLHPSLRSQVLNVRPIISSNTLYFDDKDVTVAIKSTRRPGDTPSALDGYSSDGDLQGWKAGRSSGIEHSFSLSVDFSFDQIIGIEVTYTPRGKR